MPTYDYKCPNEHYSEHQRSIHDQEPIVLCPECHQETKRVFNKPTIALLGRGFYSNGG